MLNLNMLVRLAISGLVLAAAACDGQNALAAVDHPRQSSLAVPMAYTLGPGDHVIVDITDAEELVELTGKELQVGGDGYLNVPQVGRIRAADLSLDQVQVLITNSLKRYVREPHVFVNVTSVKSRGVSVTGEVRSPGVQQLDGPKTIAQVLAVAGGLSQDAGYRVKITRDIQWGLIPLPGVMLDVSGRYSTAEILARDISEAKNPSENVLVCPNDVLTVPRALLVYVIGEVRKPGGFTLGEHSSISLLQLLGLAEGLTTTANPTRARVLRLVEGSKVRTETTVDLRKLTNGKISDLDLGANDILVVPNNATRRATVKVAETALATLSGLLIFHGL